MAFTVLPEDIYAALGVPPSSVADMDWAEACAESANAFVGRLPLAKAEPDAADLRQGAVMLAVNLYHRRAAGAVSPDSDLTIVPSAIDNAVARLLRVGGYQKPVIA